MEKEIEGWKKRVIEEKKELDEKIKRLDKYLTLDFIDEIPREAATLLVDQFKIMERYSEILGMRINI